MDLKVKRASMLEIVVETCYALAILYSVLVSRKVSGASIIMIVVITGIVLTTYVHVSESAGYYFVIVLPLV